MTGTRTSYNLPFVATIVGVATIGGFIFGYDSGVINGTQTGLIKTFGLGEAGLGITVAALLPGCAVGAFAAGRLADAWGRRGVMLLAAALFVVSAFASGAAPNVTFMIVARIMAGLGVGAASVLCPAYISETTPADVRGRLATLQQIMIIMGATGAFLANYCFALAAGASTNTFWLGFPAWRWMFWAQVIPGSIFFAALLLIPESPRFLVARGRIAEAESVLARLFGRGVAAAKVEDIRRSLLGERPPELADIVDRQTRRIRPIIWVGIGLAVFQQLFGINVVFYYGVVLWQAVGFSEADALRINIISGVLSVISCVASIPLIDSVGRKPLLIFGSVMMAVALAVIAGVFATGTVIDGHMHLPGHGGLIALIAANALVVIFNFSWGAGMWVILGEMFPNQIRGAGLAIAGAALWITNFLVSVSFPWVAKFVGLPTTYSFFFISSLLSLFFVILWVRETRGIELEDMVG